MLAAGLLLVGVALLYLGGTYLVRSSVVLAARFGVSELVIGLTLVAFGTSSPELFVSLLATLRGHATVSLGTVIGSNIANIAVIFGISAALSETTVRKVVYRREIPLVLGAYAVSALLLPVAEFGTVATQGLGIVLLTMMAGYVVLQYSSMAPGASGASCDLQGIRCAGNTVGVLGSASLVVVSVLALSGGAYLLVENATIIARDVLGVSERFIGVTLVAFGTSLPEFSTSVVAAAHGRSEVALGNILGSNVFNSLMVLGAVGLSGRFGRLESSFGTDFLIMVGLTVLLWGVVRRGRVSRLSGLGLCSCYAGYFVYLLLSRSL